jgi:hypothetical protein
MAAAAAGEEEGGLEAAASAAALHLSGTLVPVQGHMKCMCLKRRWATCISALQRASDGRQLQQRSGRKNVAASKDKRRFVKESIITHVELAGACQVAVLMLRQEFL